MEFPNLVEVGGSRAGPSLIVLALSTCGFCKRAMGFLQEHGFGYRYVFLDQVDPETKARLKQEFKDRYGVNVAFPTLIIDEKDVIIGFVEAKWKERLGLG